MARRLYTVRVIYKSGATMDFDCDEFSLSGTRATWKNAHPDPIRFGIDELAAVYQLRPDKAAPAAL